MHDCPLLMKVSYAVSHIAQVRVKDNALVHLNAVNIEYN